MDRHSPALRLRRVDLMQLLDIDCKNHCYTAYVYVELLVLHAADDAAMAAPGIVPPKPPLLPNAGWYLDRLTPINGKDVEVIDMSVRPQGPHLLMLKAWRGTFDVHVEMQNFPFDGQSLIVTLAFLNRKVCAKVLVRRRHALPTRCSGSARQVETDSLTTALVPIRALPTRCLAPMAVCK
jgi:hypothetical protein